MTVHLVSEPANVSTAGVEITGVVRHLPFPTPPTFEGHEVMSSRVRLTGATLDVETDHQIDEIVQLIVTGVVVGVAHTVGTGGELIRSHTIRLQAATAMPDIEQ